MTELSTYTFDLPERLIAQRPADRRRDARLLRWRGDGSFEHLRFADVVGLVRSGDLLVVNDTRVFPARLFGTKKSGSARVEILLVHPAPDGGWDAMVRPGRRLPPGTEVVLDGGDAVVVEGEAGEGLRRVRFAAGVSVVDLCHRVGHVPLPPYIRREDDEVDRERYQTVFAARDGSVAAPTAGLHFDEALLDEVRSAGVELARVTLHVGPGTFRPVQQEQVERGELHPEWRSVGEETLEALERCRARGGRVIAVGTTVCRTLESIPEDHGGRVEGFTKILIQPGHRFRWVDVLITNFHLPGSSLLLLVAALSPDRWREAYRIAVDEGYRFYSYGDANWIERTA